MALLVDLAHGRPRVVKLRGRCKVAADGNKSADETHEDSNTKESERGRIGDHSDEEAREIGTSENTYTERKGQSTKKGHRNSPATPVEVMTRRSPGPQISQWDLPKSTGRARRT
jgi:hypothetical protein